MKSFLCPVVFLLCACPLLAQSTPPTSNPPTNPPAQNRPAHRGGQEPCWQQAGVEKSVMEQVWTIGREARSKVEAICSDSSLTPQQRNQQAREVREQAMQKRAGLMTADQEKTLKVCQREQRGESHPGNGGGMHEGMGGGGCGEMQRGSRPGGVGNGTGNGNGAGHGAGNPPPPNQSSPQN